MITRENKLLLLESCYALRHNTDFSDFIDILSQTRERIKEICITKTKDIEDVCILRGQAQAINEIIEATIATKEKISEIKLLTTGGK